MDDSRSRADNERRQHAYESAEIAVKKVFAILGVNIDVPKEVEEFRANLRFSANMRRAADRGQLAFVVVLVTSLAIALWAGIVNTINRGG